MHVFRNYYKKIFHPSNIKTFFVLLNIRMINLSFDELRLIAQSRNIGDYENKSKEDVIKALGQPETKSKPETKPETKPKQKPKTEPKPEPKPKQTPKPEIRVNKRKFKKT